MKTEFDGGVGCERIVEEVDIIPNGTPIRFGPKFELPKNSVPEILETLERCAQQARALESQGRELYETMIKTVFRVRGQQETRNGNDSPTGN